MDRTTASTEAASSGALLPLASGGRALTAAEERRLRADDRLVVPFWRNKYVADAKVRHVAKRHGLARL